jgi:ubiquinone/menaquinone biosynthesis C-methylase UbiE
MGVLIIFCHMGKDDVINFYKKSWPIIIKLLQVDKTYCIHHGYYEKGIHTHVQSVHNMNDFIGRLLKLESKENHATQILDSGCGVGGTIIHLAKKYPHVNCKGITIIPEHIKIAKKLAKENQVSSNTDFLLADFMDTGFSPDQFDAVYLIESACYAPKKQMLIHEMYRILKPGGTLVIIDCFRTPVQFDQLLNTFYIWFCKSWGLPNLISIDEFEYFLRTECFQHISIIDLTKNIIHSIVREDVISIPYLFSMLFRKLIRGKNYKIEEDQNFLAAASLCSTIMGLKKGITYNAITAMK